MKNLQLTEEEAYVVDIAIGNLLYHYRKTRERSKGAIEAINQHLQPKLDATLRVRRKLRAKYEQSPELRKALDEYHVKHALKETNTER